MDDKKASNILFEQDFDGFNQSVWPDIIEWLTQYMLQLEAAISQPLSNSIQTLKNTSTLLPSSEPDTP